MGERERTGNREGTSQAGYSWSAHYATTYLMASSSAVFSSCSARHSIQMIDKFRASEDRAMLPVAVNDLRSFARHAKRHFAQLAQRTTDFRLLFRPRVNQQKSTAAGPQKFSALRARLARQLIIGIDRLVRNPLRDARFQQPALMQNLAKGIEIAFLQNDAKFLGQPGHLRDARKLLAVRHIPRLLRKNSARRPFLPDIEKHQPLLERRARSRGAGDWLHLDALVGMKADQIQSAKCRRILILLPDRFLHAFNFDVASSRRQFFRRRFLPGEPLKRVQQSHRKRAARAHASPRGHIGE